MFSRTTAPTSDAPQAFKDCSRRADDFYDPNMRKHKEIRHEDGYERCCIVSLPQELSICRKYPSREPLV